MKTMWLKFNPLHFFVRYLNLGRIFSSIELGFYAKTIPSGRLSDQLDNNFVADQRSPSPIHADMREQPMLDLIPFARPRSRRK